MRVCMCVCVCVCVYVCVYVCVCVCVHVRLHWSVAIICYPGNITTSDRVPLSSRYLFVTVFPESFSEHSEFIYVFVRHSLTQ